MEPSIKINEVRFYRDLNNQLVVSANIEVTRNGNTVVYDLSDVLEGGQLLRVKATIGKMIKRGVRRKIKLEELNN